MEEIKETTFIKYPPDTLNQVRKAYNLERPGRMKEAIDILEEWINKQEHFQSKKFDRDYLEILLLNCKGSIEKAKMKIDKLCTYRTLNPEFFESELMEVKFNRAVCHFAVMPKLTPDYKIIFISKGLPVEFKAEDHLNLYRDMLLCLDYVNRTVYNLGSIAIYDFRDLNMTSYLSTYNLSLGTKCYNIAQEGYGARVTAIHILSNSKLIERFMAIVKPVLTEKLANRIYMHTTLESLHTLVPKEFLPKDFGGDEPTMAELHESQTKIRFSAKENIEHMKEVLKQKTDESKRVGGKADVDSVPGTFRTLNVD